MGFDNDEKLICAALLHDVPEDTNISLDIIQQEFGEEVGHLVDGVTKVDSEEKGDIDSQTIRKYLRQVILIPELVL